MTRFATSMRIVLGKLSLVVVFMAITALLKTSNPDSFILGMTLIARNFLMCPFQGKQGEVVVKIVWVVVFPPGCGMALGTVITEFTVMNIRVAVNAFFKRSNLET